MADETKPCAGVRVTIPHHEGGRALWVTMVHAPAVGDLLQIGDPEYWGRVASVTWMSGQEVVVARESPSLSGDVDPDSDAHWLTSCPLPERLVYTLRNKPQAEGA